MPQNYVPSIKVGAKARIMVPEYPNRSFPAVVEASAQAVEAALGTTRMQLVVDNAAGELMTGAFANVSLDLANPEIALNVPRAPKRGLALAAVDPERSRIPATFIALRFSGAQ